MKIKDIPIENQPQTRLFADGVDTLSNAELMSIILRQGIQGKNALELSNELFKRFPLYKLPNCNVFELKKMFGLGNAKASQIVSFFELARRASSHVQKSKKQIKNSKVVYNRFKKQLENKKQEHFYAVFLDSRKRIITEQLISLGTNNAAIVHPREILSKAISANANAFILIHNHPSGDATPSQEDLEVTKNVANAADLMDIPLVDHVIIGNSSYYSMRDMGII